MDKKIVANNFLYDINDEHFNSKNNLNGSKSKYSEFDNKLNNIIIEEDIELKDIIKKTKLKKSVLYNSFTEILKYRTDTCDMMKNIVEIIDLEDYNKVIFIDRYWRILNDYENKYKTYKLLNNIGSSITLFGTVVTPALLTIQERDRNSLFWLTWGISLTTGLVTSLMSLFSVNKKCYISKRIYQKLISEGWSYLSLSCKYSRYKLSENPHSDGFNDFFTRIEKILKVAQIKELQSRESSDQKNIKIEQDIELGLGVSRDIAARRSKTGQSSSGNISNRGVKVDSLLNK